jgi:hypothetical protein
MFASASERSVDWAAAEELAMATILADGVPIRFTGEDVERGTFSHRHAVYHDAVTGQKHVPLQVLPQSKASFEIRNSPLSEYACVGFELGYLHPPLGLNLLLASVRFQKPVLEVMWATLPMLGILALGVLLITYVPWLTLGILHWMGKGQ